MRPIDGDKLMMSLADWWYSSFGQKETDESKAIKTVLDKIEQSLGVFALEKQEADRWIPVTERLPEEDKDVLCIAKSKFGGFYCVASHGKMYPGSDEVGWITTDYNRIVESVISAWMPLPEPYNAEEES